MEIIDKMLIDEKAESIPQRYEIQPPLKLSKIIFYRNILTRRLAPSMLKLAILSFPFAFVIEANVPGLIYGLIYVYVLIPFFM